MKLLLYGNTFFDEVYVKDKDYNYLAIGGIGNVYKVLKDKLDIHVHTTVGNDLKGRVAANFFNCDKDIVVESNTPTASATIYIRIKESDKLAFPHNEIGSTMHDLPYMSGYWMHLLYIDNLPNLKPKELEKFDNIPISCDVCTKTWYKQDNVLQMLPYIKYLFCSREDIVNTNKLMCKLCEENPNLTIIAHDPKGSSIFTRNSLTHIQADQISEINPLGAGDILAAHFIMNKCNYMTVFDSIEKAHVQTTEYLKKGLNEQSDITYSDGR